MQIDTDAILFDNDGVLVDSHPQVEQGWRALAAEFDLDIERLLVELIGKRAIDTLGQYLSGSRLAAAVHRLEDLEVELAHLTAPGPGAIELVGNLPPHRWAVVTSAARGLAVARLQGAGIPIPTNLVTADDITRGKPDPEPYLAGARVLGADPTRCLVFEDAAPGGQAARAAGAAVIAVGAQPWPLEPAARVGGLDQITVAGASDDRPLRLAIDQA